MTTATVSKRDIKRRAADGHAAAVAERELPPDAWAEQHLVLPSGAGDRRYERAVTPYWIYWQRIAAARVRGTPGPAGDEHQVEQVYLVTATQVGKTLGFLATLVAWICAVYPRSVGMVYESINAIRRASKTRLRRMFERCPRLARLFPERAADLKERIGTLLWQMTDGVLYFLNGSVANDLRSNDLPVVFVDEFDVLPDNVDEQGDPLELVLDRQKTFPGEALLAGATTATTATSHGWRRLCQGTHQRLVVACDACGAHAWLDPDQLRPVSPDLSADSIREHDDARWHCPRCDHGHTTTDRDRVVSAASMAAVESATAFGPAGGWVCGQWETDPDGTARWTADATYDDAGRIVSVQPPRGVVRSAWLNALYSPFISLGRFLAHEIVAEAGNEEEWQAHVNGWRAEPYRPRLNAVTADGLAELAEGDYSIAVCPATGDALILTVDQQGITADRSWFPWVLRLWRADGESWLVDCGGHRTREPVRGFAELDRLCERRWLVEGRPRGIDYVAIDTANGPMVPDIRRWCAADQAKRIALAGSGTMHADHPYHVVKRTRANATKMHGLARAYYYNSHMFRDALRDTIRSGHWHIPSDAPEWYHDSLHSEEPTVVEERKHGRKTVKVVWQPKVEVLPNGKEQIRSDNHWLDMEVAQRVFVEIFDVLKPENTTARERVVRGGVIG